MSTRSALRNDEVAIICTLSLLSRAHHKRLDHWDRSFQLSPAESHVRSFTRNKHNDRIARDHLRKVVEVLGRHEHLVHVVLSVFRYTTVLSNQLFGSNHISPTEQVHRRGGNHGVMLV